MGDPSDIVPSAYKNAGPATKHTQYAFYQQEEQDKPAPFQEGPINLNECDSCGRKFNETAFDRHVKVCKKVFVDKRKKFDMKKQRVEGEQKDVLLHAQREKKMSRKRTGGIEEKKVGVKIPKWKQQS